MTKQVAFLLALGSVGYGCWLVAPAVAYIVVGGVVGVLALVGWMAEGSK